MYLYALASHTRELNKRERISPLQILVDSYDLEINRHNLSERYILYLTYLLLLPPEGYAPVG